MTSSFGASVVSAAVGESTLRIDSQTDLIDHRLANGITPLLLVSRGAKAPAANYGPWLSDNR